MASKAAANPPAPKKRGPKPKKNKEKPVLEKPNELGKSIKYQSRHRLHLWNRQVWKIRKR